ncbi:hypothetical protein [uncultured Citricoccus sp.]|uniref:hypothetical protein n=1 Tax=uncultured Citricoccus sp. TaxID=614031 RepID=UPI002608EFFB|nr:hypothetical protein [uncultured Citricoccus sp.]
MPNGGGQGWSIEGYEVGHERAAGPQAGRTAFLTLYDSGEGGPTQKVVRLKFSSTHIGLSGHYQEPQFTVVLPYEDFAPMYDLLRHETPVYASYSWHGEAAELDHFRLSTDIEPPGEGPADLDAPPDT